MKRRQDGTGTTKQNTTLAHYSLQSRRYDQLLLPQRRCRCCYCNRLFCWRCCACCDCQEEPPRTPVSAVCAAAQIALVVAEPAERIGLDADALHPLRPRHIREVRNAVIFARIWLHEDCPLLTCHDTNSCAKEFSRASMRTCRLSLGSSRADASSEAHFRRRRRQVQVVRCKCGGGQRRPWPRQRGGGGLHGGGTGGAVEAFVRGRTLKGTQLHAKSTKRVTNFQNTNHRNSQRKVVRTYLPPRNFR